MTGPPRPATGSTTGPNIASLGTASSAEPTTGSADDRQNTAPAATTPPSTPARRRTGWIPGLDGLRAIAVIAVVAFHLNTDYLPGGFAGVDVFFVISGYLITRLLIGEWRRSGRIALGAFYVRRARRLLPAVLTLLAIVFTVGGTLWPEQRATLPGSSLSSLGYVTNWWLIADEQSYFVATGRPPMLQHLWSLAIEEQYYLVWAPAVIVLMLPAVARRLRVVRRQLPLVVAAAALVGALASTAAMWWIAARTNVPFEADSGRVYFGTDTHAMGLLLGSAAGAVVAADLPRLRRFAARVPGWATDLLAVAGLVGLALWMRRVDEFTPALYRGGFLLLSALTLVVVVSAARPSGRIGALLDVRPLRWIGQRSYGIYLWHWPVAVVTRPGLDVTGPAWLVDVARAVLTVVIAAASYRYVESRWRARRGAAGRVADVGAVRAGDPSMTSPRGRRVGFGRALAAVGAACVLALVAGHVTLSSQIARAEAQELATGGGAEGTDADWLEAGGDVGAGPGSGGSAPGAADGTGEGGAAAADGAEDGARPDPYAPGDGFAPGGVGPLRTDAIAPDAWDRLGRGETSYLVPTPVVAPPPLPTRPADTVASEPTATDTARAADGSTDESEAIRPGAQTAGNAGEAGTAGAIVAAEPVTAPGEAEDAGPKKEGGSDQDGAKKPEPKKDGAKKSGAITVKVSAFGDSVMLGAVKVLKKVAPKIAIDAEVGRQAWTTLDLIATRHKKGKLAQIVVIHTGNNGIVSADQLAKVLKRLKDRSRVVLVNDHVDRAWEKPNNKTLKKVAAQFDNVRLVDWDAAADENPSWLTPDGMHLQPSGAKAYAKLIAAAMR